MKVAYATYLVIIMWLVLATPYWIYSHSVNSHTTWECLTNSCFKNTHKNVINPKVWYNKLNVYSCFNKSRHYPHYSNKHIIKHKHVCPYFSKNYEICPSTNYHTRSPIKWWRDSGHEIIHIMNECSIRNNGSVVVTVDACVVSYACLK